MKTPLFILTLLFSIFCFSQEFPKSRKSPQTLSRHNINYQDDYAWLEDYKSPEVTNWVAAQNQVVDQHFNEIKKKYNIASKLREYDALSTNSIPHKKGLYYYSSYRLDKNKPASLFIRKDVNEDPRMLVDLFDVFKTNNAFITGTYPSENSRTLAYSVSVDGGDRNTVRFVNIDNSKDLDDVLTDIKFSNIAWNQDKGVFYKKNSNTQKFAADSTYQLYYHKLGKLQQDDDLVFDSTVSGSRFSFFTKENKLFIIESNKEETMENYYMCSLENNVFEPKKIVENETSATRYLHYSKGRIYYSSEGSDWGEVRSFDINNRADDKILIPQLYTQLLENTIFYDDYIVCKYKTVGKNYMIVYDKAGKFVRKFEAPYGMDFAVQFFDSQTSDLYVTFYSYTISYLNYRLNILSGKTWPFFTHFIQPKPSLFPFDYFETKTITYKSKDGTDIPMTIVHKKGVKMDGNNRLY
ncbi:hypothetical protein [Flavobacterium sp. 3HN19-14]|uniref:hypothetical protein n=1 Tax=Flavobacterium sp. 3HN19-14 TaxID=3448133 RepID=UPI003EE31977